MTTEVKGLLPWSGKIPSREEVVRVLLDEAYLAAKEMIRTHLIMDKLRFVRSVRAIENQGYRVVWYKHRGILGATCMTKLGPAVILPIQRQDHDG